LMHFGLFGRRHASAYWLALTGPAGREHDFRVRAQPGGPETLAGGKKRPQTAKSTPDGLARLFEKNIEQV